MCEKPPKDVKGPVSLSICNAAQSVNCQKGSLVDPLYFVIQCEKFYYLYLPRSKYDLKTFPQNEPS